MFNNQHSFCNIFIWLQYENQCNKPITSEFGSNVINHNSVLVHTLCLIPVFIWEELAWYNQEITFTTILQFADKYVQSQSTRTLHIIHRKLQVVNEVAYFPVGFSLTGFSSWFLSFNRSPRFFKVAVLKVTTWDSHALCAQEALVGAPKKKEKKIVGYTNTGRPKMKFTVSLMYIALLLPRTAKKTVSWRPKKPRV